MVSTYILNPGERTNMDNQYNMNIITYSSIDLKKQREENPEISIN